jgi:hypothetical protein
VYFISFTEDILKIVCSVKDSERDKLGRRKNVERKIMEAIVRQVTGPDMEASLFNYFLHV